MARNSERLREYRRKRRFDVTAEPPPETDTASLGERSIFVVQLHHARRRHYDFRLQVGDTLRSWAVPKGPSFDPEVKRLAVEVEDHPISYADFEGDIPAGQYGAGHVDIFDNGVWSTDGDAQAQLKKGHLRFDLFGERLHGRWHLVRSSRRGRQPEWFLIKDKDAYASKVEADNLLRTPRNVAKGTAAKRAAKGSRKTARKPAMERASLMRAAAALTGARAAGLRAEPFAPELARLHDSAPEGEDWLHETKWDGYRLLATVVDGRARLWSRNAIEWTGRLPDLVEAIETLGVHSARFDGELIALDGGQSDFNALQATLSGERQAPLAYMLFDLPYLEGYDLSRCALIERKTLLERMLARDRSGHLRYSTHHVGDGPEVFRLASEAGLEGIVSKRIDSRYRAGRGDDWHKVKRLATEEFAIVGYTPPKGARQGFGSLLLAKPSNGGWDYVGRVGSGFSDAQLHELSETLVRDGGTKPTVRPATIDPLLRRARWIAPERVAEVYFRGIGNQGLLRQPSLKMIRPDKTAADLRDPDAPPTRPRTARAAKSIPSTITITHPDRVVFGQPRITKQQVADYYLAVMDRFLPEVIGRPVSVVRCPDGVAKGCFFQKHVTAGLKRVGRVKLKEESGNQGVYLTIEDADSVMELVQFGAIEFHPWGSTAANPDRADRVVFDLDPGPGVAWSVVVTAARLLRRHLKALALESFLRVSGGKGLHVVVPLNPGCNWSLVKPFARAFAETLAAAHPDDFVAVANKQRRSGKIFIDYLRNGRGATSIASYSLRARSGAPVAVPIAWSELGRVTTPMPFDIAFTPKRLARQRSDPWRDIARIRQDLDQTTALLRGISEEAS